MITSAARMRAIRPALSSRLSSGVSVPCRSQNERRVHITLTAAGRKLKAKAQKIPGCILSAAQCSIPELVQLTRQIRGLRKRLAG